MVSKSKFTRNREVMRCSSQSCWFLKCSSPFKFRSTEVHLTLNLFLSSLTLVVEQEYEYRHFFLLRLHNIWHEELKHRGIQIDCPHISQVQYFIMNLDVEATLVRFDVVVPSMMFSILSPQTSSHFTFTHFSKALLFKGIFFNHPQR